MADLTVRAYNVRFGDAIFVTVPDRDPSTDKETTRHILVDFGNALSTAGGDDSYFKPAIDSTMKELGEKPIDLYVMTHEHMDHVQGLFYASTKIYPNGDFEKKLSVDYAWLTRSADPDYYKDFPKAHEQKKRLQLACEKIRRALEAHPLARGEPFRSLLENNNPRNTDQCVEYLRNVARKKTSYVNRGLATKGTHPFKEAKLDIWAPEADASDYYGKLQPMALGVIDGPAGADPTLVNPLPPAGVDAGAFYNLVRMRESGLADNLLAIDKAANNTSVVFSLKWRGWTLLFTGDAEIRSWQTMKKNNVLEPVHFLKVSHHGSHNGTPETEILELILPTSSDKARNAVISTYPHTYSGIPHAPTNNRIKKLCTLQTTMDHPTKEYLEVTFAG